MLAFTVWDPLTEFCSFWVLFYFFIITNVEITIGKVYGWYPSLGVGDFGPIVRSLSFDSSSFLTYELQKLKQQMRIH